MTVVVDQLIIMTKYMELRTVVMTGDFGVIFQGVSFGQMVGEVTVVSPYKVAWPR